MEDLLEKRFNKHPDPSINGHTSLDDEFMYMITSDPDLGCLIDTDIDQSINPCSIYMQIIIKLGIFECEDIDTLITDYKNSQFWNSLDPSKRRELIEKTMAIQEEKEQEALETIGTEKMQEKRIGMGICST